LRKRIILLTGNPGVGKTTVLMKTVNALKSEGYSAGGMISREVREGETRVGFQIQNLNTSKRGWLANINQKNGPQIGKYRVNIENLNDIGAQAIFDALENSEIIAIDEIGPMELFSAKFKQATQKALESDKLLIAVIHWKAQDKLATEARKREDAELITVTYRNRDDLIETTVKKALEILEQN